MKKKLLVLLLAFPFIANAQYTANIIGDNSVNFIYVGSITTGPNDAGNYQKIKVDVLGGAWESDAIGETTYYIANRGGLRVNQTTLGGTNGNSFTLKAYQNGTATDFYVVTSGARYKSLSLKAYSTLGGNTSQMVAINATNLQPANEIPLTITQSIFTDVNGSIGINSTSPKSKFQVNANNSGTGASNTEWIAGNFGGLAGERVVLGNLNGRASIGGHNEALNTWTNLIINAEGGNVGIGTSNPTNKLDVNGTIHSREVKVDNVFPTPDYVFERDYKLRTLTDVRKYIEKNHHLPEVPSASDVKRDGLSLGEMNMVLLKKVEELTLYIIANQKAQAKSDKLVKKLQMQIRQLQIRHR